MEVVWENIQPDNRERLMSKVQQAVMHLRSISRGDERVRSILPDLPIGGMGGGTDYGQHYFFKDVTSMLHGLVASQFPHIQHKQVSVTDGASGEIIVRAGNLPTPAKIRLTSQDCRSLLDRHVHFGHMDMEPRNILL